MSAKVAVAILNWNGVALLKQYLPSVLRHTSRELAEVVVIDNGSNDGSLEWLKQQYPTVRVVALDHNYGFAGGYNRGIAALEHEYLLLLNSDVEVTPQWIEPLLAEIERSPKIVAVQPKILSYRERTMYEYAGAEGGYMDWLGYPFCRGRIFDTIEEDRGQYGEEPKEVFWTTGACMLVRRRCYMEAGGLDENFFAHQEEIDLAWRWKSIGLQLWVVPQSIVYHYGGASLDASDPHKTFLNFRNNLWMLWKLLPSRKLGGILFCRFCLDLLAMVVFLVSGKIGDAWAVLRAWGAFLRRRPKRERKWGRERAYPHLYQHSLLWRYHICRERLFSQLKR